MHIIINTIVRQITRVISINLNFYLTGFNFTIPILKGKMKNGTSFSLKHLYNHINVKLIEGDIICDVMVPATFSTLDGRCVKHLQRHDWQVTSQSLIDVEANLGKT